MERITRDEMLMEVAHVVAKRGTCSRLQVGAVFALEGRILVAGYNGAPRGMDHCIHESYTWPSSHSEAVATIPDWLVDVVNGMYPGEPHVDQVFYFDGKRVITGAGHNAVDPGCVIAEHAERNAIYWAASQGVNLGGSDLFVTHQPCYDCARAIVALGVRRVVFSTPYRKPQGLELMLSRGIEIIDLSSNPVV